MVPLVSVRRRHANNVELLKLIKALGRDRARSFRFSILEIADVLPAAKRYKRSNRAALGAVRRPHLEVARNLLEAARCGQWLTTKLRAPQRAATDSRPTRPNAGSRRLKTNSRCGKAFRRQRAASNGSELRTGRRLPGCSTETARAPSRPTGAFAPIAWTCRAHRCGAANATDRQRRRQLHRGHGGPYGY